MDQSDEPSEQPAVGPGVAHWLNDIIGATGTLNANKVSGAVRLPSGFQSTMAAPQRFAVLMPDAVFAGDDAVLTMVEIRDLPTGVTLSAGTCAAAGHWCVPRDALAGLSAFVPAEHAVPFAAVLKVTFSSPDDSDDTWTEMLNIDIGTHGEAIDASLPAAPTPVAHGAGPEYTIIDLEVSVGTDDPIALRKLNVSFDGLPDGAFLTVGRQNMDGIWRVPAELLTSLSVVMPLDTPDFDLRVTMDSDGAPPQTAEIHVINDATALQPTGAMLSVDLAPPPDGGPCRMMVFADAKPVYDRVLTWADVGRQSVTIDMTLGDHLPYEVVLRHSTVSGKGADGPALQWLVIDGFRTVPGDAAITRRAGDLAGTWVGDLVVDVQALRRHNPNLVSTDEPAAATPKPKNDVSQSALQEALPKTASETAPAQSQQSQENSDVLTINISHDDIRKPAVLTELARLQDFMRASTDDKNQGVYGRLGLDVGKWRDMQVLGPTGAEVELRAPLPMIARLSVPGGRDNARTPLPLNLSMPDDDQAIYHVSGLVAGSLLTAGTNMGKGTWAVRPEERPHAAYLPPVQGGSTAVLRIEDATPNAERRTHLTRLVGQTMSKLRPATKPSQPLSLELLGDIFDPNGYESLSLTIGDVPPGVLLMNGTNHGGGVWTAESQAGQNIGFYTRTSAAPFSLTLTCIAMRAETGESTVVTQRIWVSPAHGTCNFTDGLAA